MANANYVVITLTDEAAKSVDLGSPPSNPSSVVVDIFSGSGGPMLPMRYNQDFTISGSTLSWAGGRYDGVLGKDDGLRIIYY